MVWEKALFTDMMAPNKRALQRIPDPRVTQFWDKERLLSHEMGESKTGKMIWDYAAIYPHDAVWNGTFPQPSYSGRPVVDHTAELAQALSKTN